MLALPPGTHGRWELLGAPPSCSPRTQKHRDCCAPEGRPRRCCVPLSWGQMGSFSGFSGIQMQLGILNFYFSKLEAPACLPRTPPTTTD